MEQTERRLFDEYSRACTGVELLQTLQRAAQSPSERVRFWEKVIDWLPKIFEVKRLQEERVRVGRMLLGPMPTRISPGKCATSSRLATR